MITELTRSEYILEETSQQWYYRQRMGVTVKSLKTSNAVEARAPNVMRLYVVVIFKVLLEKNGTCDHKITSMSLILF